MSSINSGEGKPARLPSGIDGLDTVIRGGFITGGLYIVQGPPGSGKTILGNQICFNHGARGGNALYITLLAESHARMLQNMQNMAFFDASLLAKAIYYIGVFRELEERGLQGLLDIIRREVQARGATVLVLDALVAVGETAASYTEFKKFIHDLQMIADLTQCTMFLLTSVHERPTPPEHTMVDGIVELHDRLLGWRAERDVNITKFRGDWYFRGRHSFRISDKGIAVFPRHRVAADQHGPRRSCNRAGPDRDSQSRCNAAWRPSQRLDDDGARCDRHRQDDPRPAFPRSMQRREAWPLFRVRRAAAAPPCQMPRLFPPPPLSGGERRSRVRVAASCRRADRRTRRTAVEQCETARREARGYRRAQWLPSGERGARADGLVTEFRALGVTSIYSAESAELLDIVPRPPRLEPQFTFGLSTIAENILLLRFLERRSELHRLISIAKVRDAGFEPEIREFNIKDRGIAVDEDASAANALLSETVAPRPRRKPGSG